MTTAGDILGQTSREDGKAKIQRPQDGQEWPRFQKAPPPSLTLDRVREESGGWAGGLASEVTLLGNTADYRVWGQCLSEEPESIQGSRRHRQVAGDSGQQGGRRSEGWGREGATEGRSMWRVAQVRVVGGAQGEAGRVGGAVLGAQWNRAPSNSNSEDRSADHSGCS